MEVTRAATFPPSLELVRSYKRKKPKHRIRNLVNSKSLNTALVQSKKQKIFKIVTKLFVTCFALTFLCFAIKNGNILDDLRHLSLNQYHFYLYGRPNYCAEQFDYKRINTALKKHIYGQENAIDEINAVFQRNDNNTAFALVGGRGVGKTLTLNTIQSEFQWPSNTKVFFWTTIDSQQSHLHRLLKLLPTLSTCGYNGLFIDNIPLRDRQVIADFHKKFLTYCHVNGIKAIVFYAFYIDDNDKSYVPQTAYTDKDVIVQIENVKTIIFRQFNIFDLRRCVSFECEKLHVKLSDSIIDEIVSNIDVTKIGCKTVASRVTRYFSS